MPKINNIDLLENSPDIALVCLGSGKSAYFFISNIHPDVPALIVTEHKVATDKIKGAWEKDHSYQQTDSAEGIKTFLENNPTRKPVFILTTNPQRGNEWIEKLSGPLNKDLNELMKEREAIFFIPQSPNPYVGNFAKLGTVIIGDYFQGIGSAHHDDGLSSGKFGTKELIRYNIISADEASKEKAREIIPYITLNQKTIEHKTAFELALLPTNPFLHTVGVACHIAEVVDSSILSSKTTEEFFEKLNSKKFDKETLGDSLKGKGFYRTMPQFGPDVIMRDLSNTVVKIRIELEKRNLLITSDLDENNGAHIFNHLDEKYSKQFKEVTGKSSTSVDFGKFINDNPPYQNPNIVFPTGPDGKINTNHRFFTEELPTMTMIYSLGKTLKLADKELQSLRSVIEFNQSLAGKEFIRENGELGKDAPDYLRKCRTPQQFSDLANGKIGRIFG